MPELNLTPMMDLVLTILCFFIVASISLANSSGSNGSVDIALPSAKAGLSDKEGEGDSKATDPMIVSVNSQNEMFVGDRKIVMGQLGAEIKAYLAQYPKDGAVILKADSQISYAKVIEVLAQMRSFGGEKVSLAVNKS